jgi:hypothetical protein
MPVSDLDLVRGGLADFRLDNLRISKHAIARARERHIPLEDLRRSHGHGVGRGIQVGNTIVTAITNTMTNSGPPAARKRAIRRRMEEIGVCRSLATHHPEAYTTFRALFQTHPDGDRKRVRDIIDISLRRFGNLKGSTWSELQFVLHYPDAPSDSISWTKCIV